MGDLWKRLKQLEQKWTAQEPDTYDPAILELLSDEELELVTYAGQVWQNILEDTSRTDRRPKNEPVVLSPEMERLRYASDEELSLLHEAAEILERAKQEHEAQAQPGNGNGHAPNHKQKTRGRPWKS